MENKKITAQELNAGEFIERKVREISKIVGKDSVIITLSGGVDSSAVTMQGHKALGNQLKVCFIDNGLMKQDEPQKVMEATQSFEASPARVAQSF